MSVKFRQFRIISVFDDSPNNFRCTDRRSDYCILCPIHILEKSLKRLHSTLERIFSYAKTSWGLFTLDLRTTRVLFDAQAVAVFVSRILAFFSGLASEFRVASHVFEVNIKQICQALH